MSLNLIVTSELVNNLAISLILVLVSKACAYTVLGLPKNKPLNQSSILLTTLLNLLCGLYILYADCSIENANSSSNISTSVGLLSGP